LDAYTYMLKFNIKVLKYLRLGVVTYLFVAGVMCVLVGLFVSFRWFLILLKDLIKGYSGFEIIIPCVTVGATILIVRRLLRYYMCDVFIQKLEFAPANREPELVGNIEKIRYYETDKMRNAASWSLDAVLFSIFILMFYYLISAEWLLWCLIVSVLVSMVLLCRLLILFVTHRVEILYYPDSNELIELIGLGAMTSWRDDFDELYNKIPVESNDYIVAGVLRDSHSSEMLFHKKGIIYDRIVMQKVSDRNAFWSVSPASESSLRLG